MSGSKLVFHARFPEGPADADLATILDEAAVASGLVLMDVDARVGRDFSPGIQHGATRHYGESGSEAIRFAYPPAPSCQLVAVGPYRPREDEPPAYEPSRLADMFTRICVALDADVGRSDSGGYHGIVQESEVTGGLAFVDWYQYLGPRIVERIGRKRLLDAPVFRVVEHESGGIVMLLAADPWRERISRQRVADYFCIALPGIPARNPATGEPITIPWG